MALVAFDSQAQRGQGGGKRGGGQRGGGGERRRSLVGRGERDSGSSEGGSVACAAVARRLIPASGHEKRRPVAALSS